MAINKTTNFGLNKPDKGTRDWDTYINANADALDTELKSQKDMDIWLDDRIDGIVAQAGSDNTEVVDGRTGIDGVARNVIGDYIREIDTDQKGIGNEVADARVGTDGVARTNVGTLVREIEGKVLNKLYREYEAYPHILSPATTGADSLTESGTAAIAPVTANATAYNAVIVEETGIRFNKFSVGIRLKTSDNLTTGNIGTIYFEQYNDTLATPAWETLSSYTIPTTDFPDTTNYKTFYLGGDYHQGSKVRVRINSADAFQFSADSIIITPAGKAVA